MNVALYGPRGSRWAMTERPRDMVARTAESLAIGPSAMRWDRGALVIDIAERAVLLGTPLRRSVRGRVTVHPEMLADATFGLDPASRHCWRGIAPRARIEVQMTEPELSWSGSGYFDCNWGAEPLEAGFREWQWSRAHLGREAAVLYEGVRRDGSTFATALRFAPDGTLHEEALLPSARLPRTNWAMRRTTSADGGRARIGKTWEDSPFYARSTIASRLWGRDVAAVHESLSLDRFRSPVVQWMLPYRMPRETL